MMRIGHQLYESLEFFTDSGSYCFDEIQNINDASGRQLFITEMYINYEERQVYLVLEDETQNKFHFTINGFIKLMGGPKFESYSPLYHLRNEVKRIKKLYFKRYSNALKKYNPEERKFVKKIFKNLMNDESN